MHRWRAHGGQVVVVHAHVKRTKPVRSASPLDPQKALAIQALRPFLQRGGTRIAESYRVVASVR